MRKITRYINVAFFVTATVAARNSWAGNELLFPVVCLSGQTAPEAGQDITFDDLLKLVSLGIDEDTILKRLQKSPTILTPSAEQVAELKKAGASEKLIAAMQGMRPLSPQAAEMITDFAIVLDCSGSMKEKTPEGGTKMETAKRVLTDLVQKMPEGLNMTFVIYGNEVFGRADDPRNCTAVKVARAISPLDSAGKSQLSSLIAGLRPTGATPIALSLKTAGKELAKKNAFSGLILITDGLETCGGDPAAEAAALAANKCSFGVHVVGFGTKPAENKTLKEIADAGNGKYYNADSARELADALGGIRKELEVAAKPAEKKVTLRRAIIVHKPPIKEFPALGEIQIVSYGLGSVSVAGTGGYEKEIRVPSATVKYDIMWAPKDKEMLPVPMLRGQVFAERKLVEIRPEDHLGMILIRGEGQPKGGIVISRPSNLGSVERATQCKKFGQVMVVPAGKWNIYIDDDTIEEGFEVEPGKLHELE
ncbi:MAG TPA: VWA domain-containing protein [Phycisphaerae bacterium]|nr:VWA domain-containing protein [Phycisphaerae bacterium]